MIATHFLIVCTDLKSMGDNNQILGKTFSDKHFKLSKNYCHAFLDNLYSSEFYSEDFTLGYFPNVIQGL
jgi:hypothetical protein